jgi:hypothetical protein
MNSMYKWQQVKALKMRGTGMRMIILSAEDMEVVINASQRFKLDFDDAHQYVAAEKYNLTIVSFDTDFEHADRGRKTPAQILS